MFKMTTLLVLALMTQFSSTACWAFDEICNTNMLTLGWEAGFAFPDFPESLKVPIQSVFAALNAHLELTDVRQMQVMPGSVFILKDSMNYPGHFTLYVPTQSNLPAAAFEAAIAHEYGHLILSRNLKVPYLGSLVPLDQLSTVQRQKIAQKRIDLGLREVEQQYYSLRNQQKDPEAIQAALHKYIAAENKLYLPLVKDYEVYQAWKSTLLPPYEELFADTVAAISSSNLSIIADNLHLYSNNPTPSPIRYRDLGVKITSKDWKPDPTHFTHTVLDPARGEVGAYLVPFDPAKSKIVLQVILDTIVEQVQDRLAKGELEITDPIALNQQFIAIFKRRMVENSTK